MVRKTDYAKQCKNCPKVIFLSNKIFCSPECHQQWRAANRKPDTMANGEKGYACVKCGHKTKVLNGRPTNGKAFRRTRKCLSCEHKFDTVEIPVDEHQGN